MNLATTATKFLNIFTKKNSNTEDSYLTLSLYIFRSLPSRRENDDACLDSETNLTSLRSGTSKWSQIRLKHSRFGGLPNRSPTRLTYNLTISAGSGGKLSISLS